ncbi:MAG: protein translocase subunit SecF [Deltaproteobacteria bacterium]|nr:protein translocase subunit SecF [Deltaproteobacteria bacterium]
MEFFRPDLTIDFLKHRVMFGAMSFLLATAGLVSVFVPGPNYGTDFKGGTELEIAFNGNLDPGKLRYAILGLGYGRPDVVNVQGKENQYIVRVQEVSTISEKQVSKIKAALAGQLGDIKVDEMKVSPGGDKISLRLSGAAQTDAIRLALEKAGAHIRDVTVFGSAKDNRYEARLVGLADELVRGLKTKLGDQVPDTPLRVEWVGPKAGAKLRDSAIMSMLWAIAFIMAYVAFRFDLRFAPGGIIALLHDVLITIGILVLLQKEVSLATVAALLTVVGYSINDTIVVYDRIRENMQRMRESTLAQIMNVSISQTLSRSVVTSLTTLLAVLPLFWWGTPIIRDITFALFIGILIGTYSSIYIAAPFTEWMDRRFFRKI